MPSRLARGADYLGPERRVLDRAVRVDTVGVAFPVESFRTEGEGITVTTGNPGCQAGEVRKYRASLPGGGFVGYGLAGMAWCEASLPKRVDGENVDGVLVDDVPQLVRAMCDEAAGLFVTPGPARIKRHNAGSDEASEAWGKLGIGDVHSFENPKVVRLDLVRDFQLREPGNLRVLLDGLAGVPQVGRSQVRRFFGEVSEGHDEGRGRGETLRVGPKAWGAIAYDKCAETGGKAPAGRLRTEFRLHHDQLTSAFAAKAGGRIDSLVDVRSGLAERMRHAWFDRVGFDREVVGMHSLVASVASKGLTEHDQLMFLGWAMKKAAGVPVVVDRKTDRKYRQVAKDLGLSLGGAGLEHAVTVRLDYESGTEVMRVAAA